MIILIFNLLKWLNVERLPALIPILTCSDFTRVFKWVIYYMLWINANGDEWSYFFMLTFQGKDVYTLVNMCLLNIK